MHLRGLRTLAVASTLLLDSASVIVFMASAEEVMGHSYAKIKFVKFHSHLNEKFKFLSNKD